MVSIERQKFLNQLEEILKESKQTNKDWAKALFIVTNIGNEEMVEFLFFVQIQTPNNKILHGFLTLTNLDRPNQITLEIPLNSAYYPNNFHEITLSEFFPKKNLTVLNLTEKQTSQVPQLDYLYNQIGLKKGQNNQFYASAVGDRHFRLAIWQSTQFDLAQLTIGSTQEAINAACKITEALRKQCNIIVTAQDISKSGLSQPKNLLTFLN